MGRKATDLTGKRFGKLVAIERAYDGRAKAGRPFWKCACDCGNETIVSASHLKNNSVKSCGCGQKKTDLTGLKFGRWTVTERAEIKNGSRMWVCVCECGTIKEVWQSSLLSGKSNSCGCYHKNEVKERLKTHGMSKSRIYSIYYNMKRRCNVTTDKRYKDYGGRGIKLCADWENSFEAFATWSFSNGYNDQKTIDRVDNNKGYTPENCRWVTMNEQRNNKRNTVYIELFGKRMSLKEWCEFMGWSYTKYTTRRKRKTEIFRKEDIDAISSKLKE